MKKLEKLKKGDTIAIISLSNGFLTEQFQIDVLEKNAKEMGLNVIYPKNSRKSYSELIGPSGAKLRADDLKELYRNKDVKAIFTSIGGEDTYLTIPYLLTDKEFLRNVKKNHKIFSGFSDTTVNHLMFYSLGVKTFYGPNGLNDLAELEGKMLPYTKRHFNYFFNDFSKYEIDSSDIWYEERNDFSINSLNVARISHKETKGYDVIQGKGKVKGKLLGGCIEALHEMLYSTKYPDQVEICNKYNVFPDERKWKNKVVFLENTSSFVTSEKLNEILYDFKKKKIFDKAKAVIIGKPQNEFNYNEFREVYKKFFANIQNGKIPVMYNVNFGHAYPRCVIPYDTKVEVDIDNKKITIIEKVLK